MTTDNPTQLENKLELPERIFAFRRSDGGNSWHYERLEPSDVEYVRAARVYFCSCGGALTAEEYIKHYFELAHDRGESRAPVVAPQEDAGNATIDKFLATIADGLRHAIRDHGPITKEWIGSAAKRVYGRVKDTKYDPFKVGPTEARLTAITPEFDDPPAPPTVVFHLSDGSAVKYKRIDTAPSPSSPVPPEALARASKLCRSTIPGARVELIFQNLQDAQAVHKWLCNLNTPAATPTPVSLAAREAAEDQCAWTLDDSNDGEFWETGCGEAFRFTDGGPTDNGFTFCYKCGKRISVGRYSDDTAASVGEEGK